MTNKTWKIVDLKSNPYQAEIYGDVSDVELQALTEDIKRDGLRSPIEITPLGVIIDGHQRVRAFKLLKRKAIPVHITGELSDDELKERLIRSNLNRRQLDPVSKARVIKTLAEIEHKRQGKSFCAEKNIEFRDYLAQQLGGNVSGRTIDRYLALNRLPREIQDAVSLGRLPMTKALKILSLKKPKQIEFANQIASGNHPRNVFNSYFAKAISQNADVKAHPQKGQTLRNSPAEIYRILICSLEHWIEDLADHGEDILETTGSHDHSLQVLERTIAFCQKMQALESAAKSQFLEMVEVQFPNVGLGGSRRTSCPADVVGP